MAKSVNCALSEQFVDFIIEYTSGEDEIQRLYNPDCINIINDEYAVVYKNISDLGEVSVDTYGYAAFPKLFSLLDSYNVENSGGGRVRRQPNLLLRGQNTLVGIIDTGIDYTLDIFKNADNTSRILAIWDQEVERNNLERLIEEDETQNRESEIDKLEEQNLQEDYRIFGNKYYGTVYSKEQLDNALESDNPLSVVNVRDDIGHGTKMAAIIAGGGESEEGIAPDASICVVKLKRAKKYFRDYYFVNDDIPCYQENDIMLGIKFLLEVARAYNRPLIIYIGLGTNQGNHAGTLYIERYLDFVASLTGIAVVVAAGNEVNYSHHYQGDIRGLCLENNNESVSREVVEFNVDNIDKVNGFVMEMWSNSPFDVTLGILSPTGELIEGIDPKNGVNRQLYFVLDDTRIDINYFQTERLSGDELIYFRIQNPSKGIWKVYIMYSQEVESRFDIWLPNRAIIDRNVTFLESNPYTTICSPGNSQRVITVGGYIENSIYVNSSRGYSSNGRIKPEIVASAIDTTFYSSEGTSISAAIVAGSIALLYEWAIIKGNQRRINNTLAKKYLIRGAKRDNIRCYPNRELGYGQLDIYGVFENI